MGTLSIKKDHASAERLAEIAQKKIEAEKAREAAKLEAYKKAMRQKTFNLLRSLREKFPVMATFQPLKCGIHYDKRLKAFATTRETQYLLRRALEWHMRDMRYLKNVIFGIARYDLDGKPSQELYDRHKEHARNKLAEVTAYREAHKLYTGKKKKPGNKPGYRTKTQNKNRGGGSVATGAATSREGKSQGNPSLQITVRHKVNT